MRLPKHNRESKSPEGRSTHPCAGFTLVETAVALVVMMVLALAVASLFVFAIKYNAGANDRAVALAIAQQRMERLQRARFIDAALNAGTVNETYTSSGLGYTVVTTICDTTACGGSAVTKVINVQVTPIASGSRWSSAGVTIVGTRTTGSLGAYY